MVIAEQSSAMGLLLPNPTVAYLRKNRPLPACETLADRSSIGKVDHQFAALRFREWLRDQFGGLSGRKVAELAPTVILHDPALETVVRPDVNDCGRHGLSSRHGSVSRRSPQKPDWSADDRQFPLGKLIAVMAPGVATREPASDCRGAMTGCRGLGRS
jgi:hypothetical protein